jgi:hypothetical protein
MGRFGVMLYPDQPVNVLIDHPPAQLTKQAVTVDHLMCCRFEPWNTRGRPCASADEVLTATAEQSRAIDGLAATPMTSVRGSSARSGLVTSSPTGRITLTATPSKLQHARSFPDGGGAPKLN